MFEISDGYTREDARAALHGIIEERANAAERGQRNLAEILRIATWEPVPDMPCIQATMTPIEIAAAADHSAVRFFYLGNEIDSDSYEGESTLPTVRSAIQAKQFHDASDTGAASPSSGNGFPRLTLAINDMDFNEDHRALMDTSSTSRMLGEFTCTAGATCTSANVVSGGGETSSHGMKVVAAAAADLMDGQDAAFPSSADRDLRTGIAPEAGLILLDGFGPLPSKRAVNTARSLRVDVMNLSDGQDQDACPGRPVQGHTDNDYCLSDGVLCSGAPTALKDAINLAFDDGVFYVKSAGNEGPADSSCTCTVTNPGDAEGAFPVAALYTNPFGTDQLEVRNAQVITGASGSSEGGGELGGLIFSSRERTLVGLAAPTNHLNLADCVPSGTCNSNPLGGASAYGGFGGGTSLAAPIVAAAAIAYKDRWLAWGQPTTWLDDAGHMRMQMLLQGDRVSNAGSNKLTSGFSTKYGAGRLKMRHRSDQGMDAPWFSRSGSVNLVDGVTWTRWMSADATPTAADSDIETLIVVAWWFEPFTTSAAADVLMYVDRFDPTCTTLIGTLGDVSFDNRKRISVDPNGGCMRLRFVGNDIPTGDGYYNRKIYWAYYFEDNDRDDANGPSLSSPPAVGDVEIP